MKYGNFNLGQVEAVFNKLGGEEGVMKFLRGELVVSEATPKWREENGIIRFSVTSNGKTGEEWIAYLESRGDTVTDNVKSLLRSDKFVPTSGVTYEIAVLRGKSIPDKDRITSNIRAEGDKRGWKHGKDMNPEVACLIREKFLDKELEPMGPWYIVAMHEPIEDSDGHPSLLHSRRVDGGRRLVAFYGDPDRQWGGSGGFAFVVSVSQVIGSQD